MEQQKKLIFPGDGVQKEIAFKDVPEVKVDFKNKRVTFISWNGKTTLSYDDIKEKAQNSHIDEAIDYVFDHREEVLNI